MLAKEINVIRDVLDNQLVDREQNPIGRVDGLIMELRDEGPPVVTAIELGAATLARRSHPLVHKIVHALGKRWGLRGGESWRIPIEAVRDIGIDVEVNLSAEETASMDYEKWVLDHFIKRIPGA